MFVKTIIIIAFVAIIVSLGTALFHLVKRKTGEESDKTAKALTFRIGLSLLLFMFLFIAMAGGWLQPHGISARIQQAHIQNSQSPQP